MIKINVERIRGIKKVCSESRRLLSHNPYDRHTLQIILDLSDNRIFSAEHHNDTTYVQLERDDLITVGFLHQPTTMADIRHMISNMS